MFLLKYESYFQREGRQAEDMATLSTSALRPRMRQQWRGFFQALAKPKVSIAF